MTELEEFLLQEKNINEERQYKYRESERNKVSRLLAEIERENNQDKNNFITQLTKARIRLNEREAKKSELSAKE